MSRIHAGSLTTAERRRRAEERLRGRPAGASAASDHDLPRLVHELQVHQIELEMQNEELVLAHTTLEASLEKYADLYDFAPVGYVTLDSDGHIRTLNLTAAILLGSERAALLARRFRLLVTEADRRPFEDFLARLLVDGAKQTCELTLIRERRPPLLVRLEATLSADGMECRVVMVGLGELKKAQEEHARVIAELQQALAQVKQLTGLLSICAGCKKIRDDEGAWKQIESYISEHSEASFTHGLCPDCRAKFFPGYEASSGR